jgi:hypothetical protein
VIYFLRSEQNNGLRLRAGWIKIGTTTCLSVRLKQIAVKIGHMPTVLAVFDGSYAEEHALHEKFEGIRAKGEWFLPEDVLLQLIEAEGRPWDGKDELPIWPQIRIDGDIVEKAQFIAASQGKSLRELLSEWLRPIADREFRRAGKKLFEGEK